MRIVRCESCNDGERSIAQRFAARSTCELTSLASFYVVIMKQLNSADHMRMQMDVHFSLPRDADMAQDCDRDKGQVSLPRNRERVPVLDD